MLRDAVRGAVAVAATLAEEAGRLVVGTATELLGRSGIDVAAVERRVVERFPPSAQSLRTLAEEAVTVGRAGVDLVVGVARGEVERAFETVGDQVVKLGVVLSFLEGRLRDVDEEPVADPAAPRRENRADVLFGAGWEDEPATQAPEAAGAAFADPAVDEDVAVDEDASGTGPAAGRPAAKKAPARKPPARKAPPRAAAAPEATADGKAGTETADGRSPAKNADRPTGPAKKAAAKKSPAKKATPAGKTTAKKTTAKKTTTRKATAKRTVAQPPAARKATARKTTVVKKSVTPRPPREPEGGSA
jgi:hypothetical protein